MATVMEVADQFYAWAYEAGLIHEPVLPPAAAVQGIKTDDLFPDTLAVLLRKYMIQHLAVNESASEIIIFTKRAIPTTNKKLREQLPQHVENVSLSYRHGKIQPISHNVSNPHHAAPWAIKQNDDGGKFYACGSSISVGNNREAGTFGALVRDENGNLFGLSNNHVTGSCNYAPAGLPIVAPGVLDVAPGGISPFTIGFHEKSLQIVAGHPGQVDPEINLDAAIFRIADPRVVTSWQGNCYDTPSATMPLADGMAVEKVGRTTGATSGRVLCRVYNPTAIFYNAPLYSFSGNVYFDPLFIVLGHGDVFSDSGDSGSLIVHTAPNGERFAVGIVVGGCEDSSAPGGKLSLVIPIEPILENLGVSLVSGHNG